MKNYVLDTNILMQDSEAIYKFEENDVYIPLVVADELDNLKNHRDSETALQAKRANHVLKDFLKNDDPTLPGGGTLHFVAERELHGFPDWMEKNKPDHIILQTTRYIQNLTNDPTILITNDNALAVKARQYFGIPVEDYRNQQVRLKYTGRETLYVPETVIRDIYVHGEAEIPADIREQYKLFPNTFLVLKALENEQNSAIGIYRDGFVQALRHLDENMSGVTPLNVGQKFAKEALMADIDEAPLVMMAGPAGTAKTFLAIAAGMEMVEQEKVRQVLLLRPQAFFDSDIGYLPGSEQEKIQPLMRPFVDNLSVLLKMKGMNREEINSTIESYLEFGLIRAESFTYIRGRSITDSFIIIDEAQNATRTQIIGAITRAGIGSKIVITGDPKQVDTPRLDSYNNGLVFAMDAMKDSPLSYEITFRQSECKRSALAKDAIDRLLNDDLG